MQLPLNLALFYEHTHASASPSTRWCFFWPRRRITSLWYAAHLFTSPFHHLVERSHCYHHVAPQSSPLFDDEIPIEPHTNSLFTAWFFVFFTKTGTKVILDPCKTMDIGTGTFRINLTVARALLCFPCVLRIAPSSLCVCKALAFSSIDLCFPSLVFS